MAGSVDLNFASKGTAQVLRDQQLMKDGGKAMAALYKQENREMAQLGRDASRIFNQTRTDAEKLQQTAAKLREAVANTKLPDLERAKAADALKRVESQIKNVDEAGKKVDGTLTNAFGAGKTALLGSFATVAGGVATTVGAGIKIIVDELRAAQALADKAAATQLSVAASRNVVIRNLPGASESQIQEVLTQNAGLASSTGVSETAINQARASALSASGGNVGASLDATEIAAKFLADRPGEIGDFAGSLLDLSKVTGSTDAKVNLGLLSAVGGLSRITDQRQQATNIPAALIGARGFGFNTAESASLFSALTTGSGDLTGASSGTATVQFARQLSEFTGTQDNSGVEKAQKALAAAQEAASGVAGRDLSDTSRVRSLKDAETQLAALRSRGADPKEIARQEEVVRRRRADRDQEAADQASRVQESRQKVEQAQAELRQQREKAKSGVDLSALSTGEKLRALQANPALAEAFLADASFETKSLAPIRDLLLNSGSDTTKSFESNLSQIPGLRGLQARGGQSLASFDANTLEARARVSRGLDSLLEQQLVGQPGDLSTDEIQKIQELLQSSGASATGSRLLTFFSKFSDGKSTLSIEEARAALESRRNALLSPVQAVSGGTGGGGVAIARRATESDRDQAALLDRILKVLEAGNTERKKQTDKISNGGIPVTGG